MGYGVFIEQGLQDWQILQHKQGHADVQLSGSFTISQEYMQQFDTQPEVVVRLVCEQDNSQVITWSKAQMSFGGNGMGGSWNISFSLPAGGLYRLETALKHGEMLLRGDVRLHIGVGNLFAVAGQSNAAGYGRDPAYDPPQLGVHLLRNCGRWDLACHPINETTDAADIVNAEHGISGTSPYISFGKRFAALSGLPVGLISTALGGSPISRWVNRLNGDLYRNMLDKLKLCGGQLAGILWYQGCSDTDTTEQAENYFEHFSEMVSDLRNELAVTVPFFTLQLNRHIGSQSSERWSVVKEAQRKAANQLERIYMLPTSDCTLSDLIHNSSRCNITLGERLAKQCAHVLCGGERYFAPDIQSTSLSGNRLTLSFSEAEHGFEAFNHAAGTGFAVEDEEGAVAVTAWSFEKNQIILTLARLPHGKAMVSFGVGAEPTLNPVCDNRNFLPIVCFHCVEIL